MSDQLLNDKLIDLLKEHELSQSELARRIGVRPSTISQICTRYKNLGAKSFIKMLRKGFDYSSKEATNIFVAAMLEKYRNDLR